MALNKPKRKNISPKHSKLMKKCLINLLNSQVQGSKAIRNNQSRSCKHNKIRNVAEKRHRRIGNVLLKPWQKKIPKKNANELDMGAQKRFIS